MTKKIALVTGGSRGIGAATAQLLAQQGIQVVINYQKNQLAAEQITDSIIAQGYQAIAIQADVSQEEQVVELFKQIDVLDGKLTMLVNNAGILMQQSPVSELTAERINKILSNNVTSYFLCCREAIKRMSPNNGGQGGAIVNVSSAASRLGAPNEYVDYAASKGAIDSLTKGLSLEVAAENIRVNSVRPGFIYTEMHADGGEANRVERVKENIPMKRGGQPIEVAQAITWLLSEQASYVTGSHIELAGGK
ncbi:NAD(P)-dependent oxidoreductase [Thalassotalea insulae]|uniref:NAD(P)-dependent oxidoreductase n=1 Tax=Thalassotalea insulae TaxID=2056778 RepID=A0ABQ6GVQ4_9GAMM|nr:SDR family oxidoreductase [Thalassotalea insulae]GLX79998.1 NAD(P)-dependent oxidoreductase [Thalassotalea insulae]